MEKKYGVLLDLDGTIYKYETTHSAALKKTYQTLIKITPKATTYEHFCVLYHQAKLLVKKRIPETAASHNRMLQFQKMLELINIPTSPHALELYNAYWNYFLKKIQPFPDVKNYLETISKQEKICLVTNLTAHIQYKKIEKLNIDYIVTSEEVGLEKPHPMFFYHAKTLPENTYIIGDNLHDDITGGKQLGITGFFFNPHKNKVPKDVISFSSFTKGPKIPC